MYQRLSRHLKQTLSTLKQHDLSRQEHFYDLQGLIVKLQLTLLNFARLEYFTSTKLAQLHRYVAV